jgi:MinD-like ATPase involved in chromosome partitioning or flagellar assembly
MSETKTIALHSYKGGTGKTTIISNLAAYYARSGFKVCLLDFDLTAPSLSIYFRKQPSIFMNDLLNGDADISDVLIDVSADLDLKGKLCLGFSSPKKEDLEEVEMRHDIKWQLAAIRRAFAAKKKLRDDYHFDFVFLDSSPGIRYWSINSLAVADYLLVVMKNSDMDIAGTKKMIEDIYDELKKHGSKYFIVLNKVPGASPIEEMNQIEEKDFERKLEEEIGAKIIGKIPCFCDIQFSKHEFLFAVKKPDHPFSKQIATLAQTIRELS